jgi:periplasmic divalent cation tolerance protein
MDYLEWVLASGAGMRIGSSDYACVSDLRLLYTTCADREQALALVRPLVAESLIACANILPGMTSCYRWQGVVEEASEVVVILKTRSELAEAAMTRVVALHPYETPCVVVLPIEAAHSPFAEWVRLSTGA